MAKFHSLNVSKITRPTEDAVAVTFDVPEELQETFAFIQGQHLTLKKDIEGEAPTPYAPPEKSFIQRNKIGLVILMLFAVLFYIVSKLTET